MSHIGPNNCHLKNSTLFLNSSPRYAIARFDPKRITLSITSFNTTNALLKKKTRQNPLFLNRITNAGPAPVIS